MSKTKEQYKPDYGWLYPDTPISGEVADVLTKSDRKMEYQEYDLKRDTWKVDPDAETAVYVPSREDSLDRLMEAEQQFPHEGESVEDTAERSLMLEKMRSCLPLLAPWEREMIDGLYFSNGGKGTSERKYADEHGIPRKTLAYQNGKILSKLRRFMES